MSSSVRGEVVVDEEASGSSGEARGGVDQRRRSQVSGGLRLAIGAAPAVWCQIDGGRVISEERGADGVKKLSADLLYL